MRTCNGCRFCCWSFNVEMFPLKHEITHCMHECEKGCALHGLEQQPETCRDFKCPYLTGEDIYKPSTFQNVLEELRGNMGNYIPAVATHVPINAAINLIRESRSLPAFILIGNTWLKLILPLDRNSDGSWATNDAAMHAWINLYEGQKLNA